MTTRAVEATRAAARRVLVTGANGFIGQVVCRELLAAGHGVRGLVRSPQAAAALPAGVEVVTGDLEQPLASSLVAGVDAVIHLAARVHVMHESASDAADRYARANTDATRRLVELARNAGVARFVFVSTVKVHGERGATVIRADDPLAPDDAYARSKAEAEAIVREHSGAMSWTIVRPTFVFGEGGKGNFPRLASLTRLAARVPLPLGGIRNARSLVYVGNLASLLAYCATGSAGAGQALLAAEADAPSTPELIRRLGSAMGLRPRLFAAPVGVLRSAARLVGRGAEIDRLTETLRVDSSANERLPGWRAPFTLDEGLRRAVSMTGAP